MDSYLQNYINGQWVDSLGGKRHQVISPSTEEPCTEITLGTKADVDAVIIKYVKPDQLVEVMADQYGKAVK